MEPIKTSDTSLAAYLHYHRHMFVGMMKDPNDTRRRVFVFIKKEESPTTVEEYTGGQVTVNPKGYYKSIRFMHQMLREGNVIDENFTTHDS